MATLLFVSTERVGHGAASAAGFRPPTAHFLYCVPFFAGGAVRPLVSLTIGFSVWR